MEARRGRGRGHKKNEHEILYARRVDGSWRVEVESVGRSNGKVIKQCRNKKGRGPGRENMAVRAVRGSSGDSLDRKGGEEGRWVA